MTLVDAPIFVVGAPRSGTTLTASILGRHAAILSLGETHFYEDIWSRRRSLGDLSQPAMVEQAVDRAMTLFGRFNFPAAQSVVAATLTPPALVARTLASGSGYAALYQAFMGSLTEAAGCQRWCDDTPKHLFYLPAIFEHFPRAQVIACVRDPRDFLCSYQNYWRRSTESERVRALYHPILTSLVWRASANAILKYRAQFDASRLHVLFYESLVTDPETTVRNLCHFLEISWSPALLAVDSQNSSFAGAGIGIYTTSVGRWRTCLAPAELWWGQRLAGSGLTAFGYRPEAVRAPAHALAAVALSTPLALGRALAVNRHKRGPLGPYLARRLATLVGR